MNYLLTTIPYRDSIIGRTIKINRGKIPWNCTCRCGYANGGTCCSEMETSTGAAHCCCDKGKEARITYLEGR